MSIEAPHTFRTPPCPPIRLPGRLVACLLAAMLACLQSLLPVHAADWQYRVRPGDTLWDLAARHMKRDIAWQRLQAHNQIADPQRLPPGTRLRFPVQWLRVHPKAARVDALHGAVTVQAKPGAPARPAAQGMALGIGAVLETGDDASATIQFADRSRTLVMSNSRVEFDRLSAFGETGMVDTRMRLQRGRTSNQVEPSRGPASRFIINTPSATTSVRGTHFRVASAGQAQRSVTEVLHGKVDVLAGGTPVRLSGGFGVSTEPGTGAAPARQALLPAPGFVSPPQVAHAATPVSWTALQGAERYRVLVARAAQSDTLVFETTTQSPGVRLPALAAGEYLLTVRGIAASGLEGEDATHPVRVPPGPPAPLAMRVGNQHGQVAAPRPRFAWAQVEQAASYHVQVAPDDRFAAPVADVDAVQNTSMRPPQDLPPGVYHWRVNARDTAGNTGPYSDVERFEVVEAPPPGLQAGDGARILHWASEGEGVRYRVQVSRRADFAKPLIDREVDAPQLDLQELRGGRWHIRVQSLAEDGYAAPFGAAQTIELPCRWCKLGAGAAAALLLLAL